MYSSTNTRRCCRYTTPHCNTLHCDTLQHTILMYSSMNTRCCCRYTTSHCNTQHCDTLQHTALNALIHEHAPLLQVYYIPMQYTTLQPTATHRFKCAHPRTHATAQEYFIILQDTTYTTGLQLDLSSNLHLMRLVVFISV